MTRKLVATLKMWSPWRPGARNLCTHHERQILMTVSKYFTGITKKNRDRFQAGIRTLPSTNAYQARQHLILLWRIPTIMCGHSRGYATNSVQWTSQTKTRKRYATSLGIRISEVSYWWSRRWSDHRGEGKRCLYMVQNFPDYPAIRITGVRNTEGPPFLQGLSRGFTKR